MSSVIGGELCRILVVEDDRDLAFVLERNLTAERYAVSLAGDGRAGLETALAGHFALIVLDLMLPKIDGYRVLQRLRAAGRDVPVLLLTARDQERDKIYGFRVGADDYVTKPFSMGELVARIGALLRRSARATDAPHGDTRIEVGPFVANLVDRQLTRAGERIDLSPKAFDLMVAFLSKPGAVLKRGELLRQVWGYDKAVESRTLDTHIAELRKAVEPNPGDPTFVQTVWRIGYRFRPPRDHRA